MTTRSIELTVNGTVCRAEVEPRTALADFLRDDLLLTGTHLGCEHGVCGACTVNIDGVPARSCITYAVLCDKAHVTTIEGFDGDEVVGRLRQAFSEEHGLQCGFCTPGMIATARDIVLRLPEADDARVRLELSGNLCRCTGYSGIVRAIRRVLDERKLAGQPAVNARTRLGPAGSGHAGASLGRERVGAGAAPAPAEAALPAPSQGSVAALPGDKLSGDAKPSVAVRHSFVVPERRDRVWAFFENVEDVVACMPGASLTEATPDGRLSGQMSVRLGPISATFLGNAEIARDPARYSGTIRGHGRDRTSGSGSTGEIRYALVDEGERTRVDIDVTASLTGTLAQFGRLGLVNDLVRRLTDAFSANLQARLRPGEPGGAAGEALAQPARLDLASMLLAVIGARLRLIANRLRGR